MDYIRAIERQQIREDIPRVIPGDHVRVHYRIKEGDREREQVFQGDVIRLSGSGARETFTVRKMSFGVGVERTFPLHSPKIASSKLYVTVTFIARSFTTCVSALVKPLVFARNANCSSQLKATLCGFFHANFSD